MAANNLPNAIDDLFTLAERNCDGLAAHQTTIGILQCIEVTMSAVLASARTAQANFAALQGGKPALTAALNTADTNGRAYTTAARNVLALSLGQGWSQVWEATGFPNQSLAIPATLSERQSLLASLKTYFTSNPTMENAALTVTAAQADVLFIALSNALAAVDNGLTAIGQKKNLRDAAVELLRKRMRCLIAELALFLPDEDPRWDAFGLNRPGAPSTPDRPEALVLTPGVAGTLLADWADAPRADRYRVWIQIMGVDTEFRPVATVTDSDATLTGLGSGKTVKVRVTAVNDAGESAPSAVVEAVTL